MGEGCSARVTRGAKSPAVQHAVPAGPADRTAFGRPSFLGAPRRMRGRPSPRKGAQDPSPGRSAGAPLGSILGFLPCTRSLCGPSGRPHGGGASPPPSGRGTPAHPPGAIRREQGRPTVDTTSNTPRTTGKPPATSTVRPQHARSTASGTARPQPVRGEHAVAVSFDAWGPQEKAVHASGGGGRGDAPYVAVTVGKCLTYAYDRDALGAHLRAWRRAAELNRGLRLPGAPTPSGPCASAARRCHSTRPASSARRCSATTRRIKPGARRGPSSGRCRARATYTRCPVPNAAALRADPALRVPGRT